MVLFLFREAQFRPSILTKRYAKKWGGILRGAGGAVLTKRYAKKWSGILRGASCTFPPVNPHTKVR